MLADATLANGAHFDINGQFNLVAVQPFFQKGAQQTLTQPFAMPPAVAAQLSANLLALALELDPSIAWEELLSAAFENVKDDGSLPEETVEGAEA